MHQTMASARPRAYYDSLARLFSTTDSPVKPYSGHPCEYVYAFVEKFRIYAAESNWTPLDYIRNFRIVLRDEALDWYIATQPDLSSAPRQVTMIDFERLIFQFFQRFGGVHYQRHQRAIMSKRVRGIDEGVGEFLRSYYVLMREAFPCHSEVMLIQLASLKLDSTLLAIMDAVAPDPPRRYEQFVQNALLAEEDLKRRFQEPIEF